MKAAAPPVPKSWTAAGGKFTVRYAVFPVERYNKFIGHMYMTWTTGEDGKVTTEVWYDGKKMVSTENLKEVEVQIIA